MSNRNIAGNGNGLSGRLGGLFSALGVTALLFGGFVGGLLLGIGLVILGWLISSAFWTLVAAGVMWIALFFTDAFVFSWGYALIAGGIIGALRVIFGGLSSSSRSSSS